MVKIPAAQPVPRVIRSRRDDRYQAGHPAPAKRANAGYVVSQQTDTDTVTVDILDEQLPGVVFLGDMPPVGAIVEVEARGDLLVIPFWLDTGGGWTTLPTVTVRVAESSSYTQEVDLTSGEIGAFSGLSLGYEIARAFITPDPPIYQRSDAWDCVWQHVKNASTAGSQNYNNPPDDGVWNGSYVCRDLPWHPTYDIGWHGPTWSNRTVGWSATAAYPSWMNLANAGCRWLAYSVNVGNIVATFGPSAGQPDPEPPPGMVVEWENPAPQLTRVDATLVEPTDQAATNTGEIYAAVYRPDTHGFGPNPADNSHWKNAAGFDNLVCVGPWSGATDTWVDITDLVETTGPTWFTIIPPPLATGEEMARPSEEASLGETRWGVAMAFRLHLLPSRYKFVPEP